MARRVPREGPLGLRPPGPLVVKLALDPQRSPPTDAAIVTLSGGVKPRVPPSVRARGAEPASPWIPLAPTRILPAMFRALLLIAAVSTLGCRTPDVASANLDQLMRENHRFRYLAKVRTGVDYILSSLINPAWFEDDSILSGTPEPIPNPDMVALENLIALKDSGVGLDGEFLAAERVRHYTRYAIYCPSILCRERAMLELGPLAADLRVEALPQVSNPVGAAELGIGIRGLKDVLKKFADREATETDREDLIAACELLEGYELDIEGGRRLLRVLAAYGKVFGLEDREREPLSRLSRQVQRRLVGLALVAGRNDRSGRVRAAAIRSNYQAHGDAFLDEALRTLPLRFDSRNPFVSPNFEMIPALADQDEPLLEVCLLLKAHGLPHLEGRSASETILDRLNQIRTLVEIAVAFERQPEHVRVSAMQVLSQVTGDLSSLREEEWHAWYNEYAKEEQQRHRRALAAESAGDGA